jgi:hypothetical protein
MSIYFNIAAIESNMAAAPIIGNAHPEELPSCKSNSKGFADY